MYHVKVTNNYEFQIKHTKKYTEICRSFPKEFRPGVLVTCYENAAIVHGLHKNYLEELKCLEKSATLQVKLNGGINSGTIKKLTDSYKKLGDRGKAEYLAKTDKQMVKNRGVADEESLEIKEKLQKFLNDVQDYSSRGKWLELDKGWNLPILNLIFSYQGVGKSLFMLENKLKAHGIELSAANIEKARMLVFEAINLGIMTSKEQNKHFECSELFCKENAALVEKISQLHPEYFVDELIVRQLFTDEKNIKKIIIIDKDVMKSNQANWFNY